MSNVNIMTVGMTRSGEQSGRTFACVRVPKRTRKGLVTCSIKSTNFTSSPVVRMIRKSRHVVNISTRRACAVLSPYDSAVVFSDNIPNPFVLLDTIERAEGTKWQHFEVPPSHNQRNLKPRIHNRQLRTTRKMKKKMRIIVVRTGMKIAGFTTSTTGTDRIPFGGKKCSGSRNPRACARKKNAKKRLCRRGIVWSDYWVAVSYKENISFPLCHEP